MPFSSDFSLKMPFSPQFLFFSGNLHPFFHISRALEATPFPGRGPQLPCSSPVKASQCHPSASALACSRISRRLFLRRDGGQRTRKSREDSPAREGKRFYGWRPVNSATRHQDQHECRFYLPRFVWVSHPGWLLNVHFRGIYTSRLEMEKQRDRGIVGCAVLTRTFINDLLPRAWANATVTHINAFQAATATSSSSSQS